MSEGSLKIPNDKKMEIIHTPQWQQMKVNTIEEFDNYFEKTISQRKSYIIQNLPYGIIAFIIAIGLWKMKKWSRITGIVYSILLILFVLLTRIGGSEYFLIGKILGIITSLTVVYYLMLPKVKEQFK
jgi:uncharacterized membrane protein (DUF2068 family)